MKTSFLIDYELTVSGWARGTIGFGSHRVHVVASYLNDPLSELAFSAQHLFQGGDVAAVVFMNEPGEHHLVFTRMTDEECRFTLTWFDDNISHSCHALSESELVMSGTVSIRCLIDQVCDLLERLLQHYGTVEYKARWGKYDFPLRELSTLRLMRSSVAR